MTETIKGSVEHVTYYNPENGYCVFRLRTGSGQTKGANRSGLVTVTGNFPELSNGESLIIKGNWVTHKVHGTQFQMQEYEQKMPATLAGIQRYLGSGMIKGVGSRLSERIVDYFGIETLDVIENHPERLLEVPDIGPKRARIITSAWDEHRHVKNIMLFLHSQNISTNLAVKIYKHYGDGAIQILKSDPYQLTQDIYGVGFKTADKIARDMGLPINHPSRIEAGIIYALDRYTNAGNVYYPLDDLKAYAADLLQVSPDLVISSLPHLQVEEKIYQESVPSGDRGDLQNSAENEHLLESGKSPPAEIQGTQAVYLTPLYYSEVGVAQRLSALASHIPSRLSDLPPAFISIDPGLSDEQEKAIRKALSNPVSVLTGGPGTGKTTTIRALISVLETAKKTYALASPTGRAAKRLSQTSDRPASTIHRLLSYAPGEGFRHNAANPLSIDMLVVDEASMLDLVLANHLLKALKPGMHLLLVGDYDQLPSVGAGDVLRDVIKSGVAAVTRLSVIFRQAAHSHIITNAHRINQGQMPIFPSSKSLADSEPADFFLFPCETPEEAASWVQDIVCNRIPEKFGFNPRSDIQVLSPMYRGPAGVDALNVSLQSRLNPPASNKPEKTLLGQTFRLGDKLMQLRNNYDKDVYNGDIGQFTALNLVDQTFTIDFEGRSVVYDWSELDQLQLAYAVSVHKAQGSEFPAVVIPLVTQHYMMLQRNLLYTAITRAKKLCVLVGSRRAIGIAVRNNKVAQRHSGLEFRLRAT